MNSINLFKRFKFGYFDLVWIDGDHLNPQVTIDIFQSIIITKKNAIICVDDVIKDEYISKYGSNESNQTIETLSNSNIIEVNYLIKRINNNSKKKKYIAFFTKKN